MLFLGIASLGRNSAVALLDEHSILAAIEEEKLTRAQLTGNFPRYALAESLKQCGATVSDINLAALADTPQEAWLRESGVGSTFAGSRTGVRARKLKEDFHKSILLRQLRQHLPNPVKLAQFDHHLCHAASAFYTSDFERSLILTLDEGCGSHSGQIALGEGDEIRTLRTLRFPDSLGWFYSRVTEMLGLRPHRDEHKVQWLGRNGQAEFVTAFQKLFSRDANGLPVLNRRYFVPGPDQRGTFSRSFYKEMGIAPEKVSEDPAVAAALARSAQTVLEEIVLGVANRFQEQTRADSLCIAGGVFFNVLLVRALETRSNFKKVQVQPLAGNAGTALGAALLARKKLTGKSQRGPLISLALGPEFTSQETKAVLDNCKIIYKYMSGEEQLAGELAKLLQANKIVAWCHGRTEFGHRALGNRSILASPFSEYVIENVNHYIKHREDFHPFALSVPAERAAEFFDCSDNCKFMASLATLKNPIAGLEQFAFNGTSVRVHTVEKQSNPAFWKLLHKFGETAPAPILVNTSFNLFGEPLVSDPREAVRSFYCSGIDALAIGPFLVVK
ncbi:MAG TPA: carbamoyltransferase C-terminal domain-containing protein [Candidatus Acidoferrum sp.]|jgi:carbamoyltransferase